MHAQKFSSGAELKQFCREKEPPQQCGRLIAWLQFLTQPVIRFRGDYFFTLLISLAMWRYWQINVSVIFWPISLPLARHPCHWLAFLWVLFSVHWLLKVCSLHYWSHSHTYSQFRITSKLNKHGMGLLNGGLLGYCRVLQYLPI